MGMEQQPYLTKDGIIAYRNFWVSPTEEEKRLNQRKYNKERGYYLRRYGLTLEDYENLLEQQGGVCALCGRYPSENRRLVVDHCHKTGAIRGLLCDVCNTAIGLFGDNPDLLRLAAEYLENVNLVLPQDFY